MFFRGLNRYFRAEIRTGRIERVRERKEHRGRATSKGDRDWWYEGVKLVPVERPVQVDDLPPSIARRVDALVAAGVPPGPAHRQAWEEFYSAASEAAVAEREVEERRNRRTREDEEAIAIGNAIANLPPDVRRKIQALTMGPRPSRWQPNPPPVPPAERVADVPSPAMPPPAAGVEMASDITVLIRQLPEGDHATDTADAHPGDDPSPPTAEPR